MSLRQVSHEKAFRRWWNLSLGKEMPIAVAFLVSIG
jgi:hypothetical protein